MLDYALCYEDSMVVGRYDVSSSSHFFLFPPRSNQERLADESGLIHSFSNVNRKGWKSDGKVPYLTSGKNFLFTL